MWIPLDHVIPYFGTLDFLLGRSEAPSSPLRITLDMGTPAHDFPLPPERTRISCSPTGRAPTESLWTVNEVVRRQGWRVQSCSLCTQRTSDCLAWSASHRQLSNFIRTDTQAY